MAEEKKPVAGAKPSAKAKKKIKAYKPGRSCPKCGSGVRLADHPNRRACGRCGYYEKK